MYNNVTDRSTNNCNITFFNVNRCSFLINTRCHQHTASITVRCIRINSLYSSFNASLWCRNTVTIVVIITVDSINIDNFFKFGKRTARGNTFPLRTSPHMKGFVVIILIPELTSLISRTSWCTSLDQCIVTSLSCKSSEDIIVSRRRRLCILLCIVNNIAVLKAVQINRVSTDANSYLTTRCSLIKTSAIYKDVIFNSSVNLAIYPVINSFSRCNLGVIADPGIAIIQCIVIAIPIVVLQILINIIRDALAVSLLNSIPQLFKVFIQVIRPNSRTWVKQSTDVVNLSDPTDLNVVNSGLTRVNRSSRGWWSSPRKLYNRWVGISNLPRVAV